ncbi:MAG: N-acyl homoserine lactonase family protein [Subtercola sp.]|nr:N-acyl homoserine lactonase family protein [Subtercola sp.]
MSNERPRASARDDEYEIVVVEHGSLVSTRTSAFLNFVDYAEPDEAFDFSYYFWVVRNAHRTVVVDTGFSRAGAEARKRTVLADPRTVFAELGLQPDMQTTVVISHAHYDHIGNLDYFTEADVVVAQAEYDFWRSPQSQHAQLRHFVDQIDIDTLESVAAEGRLRTVGERTQIAPGIDVIPGPGHTPGELMVLVQTNVGPILLTADAVHFDEELERDMPFRHMCSLTDSYDTYAVVKGLLASGEAAQFVAGHEPSVMSRFENRAGDLEHTVTIGRRSRDATRPASSTRPQEREVHA